MFSRQVSLPDLVDFCRSLRHQLGAGLPILRVFQQQSERGRSSIRAVAGRMSDEIRKGSSLSSALERENGKFPPLFTAMVKVGEATGNLAEIFGELERYFDLELQLRRRFRSQMFLPVVQFFFAVAIFAATVYIVGVLNPNMLTIFGLSGGAGALAILGVVGGSIAAIILLYQIATRLSRQGAWMDGILLALPALGPCLRAIAMSRFTLALQLTLDSGMSIKNAVRLSFEATSNAYFAAQADAVIRALKNGESLHESLASVRIFADDFLEMVVTAEEAGTVPEMMRRLTEEYQADAARKLKVLTYCAGALVGICVAAFIIWAIFKLAGVYIGALEGKI